MLTVEQAKGLAEIADRLFGKLGVAAFLGSLAFLLTPNSLFAQFRIDAPSASLRTIAVWVLFISTFTCLVSLLIRMKLPAKWSAGKFASYWIYFRLPDASKIFLGAYAQADMNGLAIFPKYEPAQKLIDIGLMEADNSTPQCLVLSPTTAGRAFIRQHRTRLRRMAIGNQDAVKMLIEQDRAAVKTRGGSSWMRY
jgi:hypothetical protein